MDNGSTEEIEGKSREQGGAAGDDGSAQSAVNGTVEDGFDRVFAL